MSRDLTTALAEHPWIAAVAKEGDTIRVRPAHAATAVRPEPGPLVREYLEHWGEVYDFTYTSAGTDLAGWRASDTGEPFPADHMADWVDRTVELVLGTRPRWVLELGCGTGLLATRLRPHLSGYVGTDVAQSAVDKLAAGADERSRYVRAAAHELAAPEVRAAMAAAGFPATGPDCVLLNSVLQHFPDVAYLTAVVVDALRLLAPGGHLVIGDVRHAGLLLDHHRRIAAATDPSTAEETARVRAERDDELNVDPATLAAAAADSGRPVRISVRPRALAADTELTRYRFDAVLRVDPGHATRPEPQPWSGITDLLAIVDSGQPVRVDGIPNRLRTDLPGAVTARELRDALGQRDAVVLLDPCDPARLAVAAPASAAETPVAALAAHPTSAHEPFPAFLTRRVGELVRSTARRLGVPAPEVTVDTTPLAAAAETADQAADPEDVRRIPGLLRDLDRVALLAMAATFGDTTGTPDEIADRLRVAPRHRWILRRWLAALIEEGMAAREGAVYRIVEHVSRSRLTEATRDIDRARVGMGYPPELTRFFATAAEYLPELMRDEVALQSLLFADGETGTAEGAYRDNPVNRYVNAAAAHLVRAHARPGDTLRVLEVGAGVGGTTADVLAALADVPVDYLFTDVSRFFLTDARERFGDRVRYGRFDIDTPGVGAEPRSLDVVLGANVLHNAHDIDATLRGLRDLLVPGGLLVFVDTTREIRQILTSMQFLMSARPGHEQAGTGDARAGTDRIFLSEQEWTTALLGAGFEPLGVLPRAGHPLHPVGVRLFAAVGPH